MLAITAASERNNGRQSDFLMSMVIILMICLWMDGIAHRAKDGRAQTSYQVFALRLY